MRNRFGNRTFRKLSKTTIAIAVTIAAIGVASVSAGSASAAVGPYYPGSIYCFSDSSSFGVRYVVAQAPWVEAAPYTGGQRVWWTAHLYYDASLFGAPYQDWRDAEPSEPLTWLYTDAIETQWSHIWRNTNNIAQNPNSYWPGITDGDLYDQVSTGATNILAYWNTLAYRNKDGSFSYRSFWSAPHTGGGALGSIGWC
jgi:hypothetical protein